ncbi:hypothetical protein HOLleu_30737 [Holothuria leucospilota]|uniref:DUF4190 domain-containing protein n=1 Tax=Holothuria leucospilota TaxID=206669 RepID=A0A9Q1BKU9_HOLLE|nr:hypothetical protein HOLleu_30737 [Holothuria leucospilota]
MLEGDIARVLQRISSTSKFETPNMESLVKNEQLPATSPPPMRTSSSYVAGATPPLYSLPPPNPPPYGTPSHTSVIVVRNQQYWEPDPPGVVGKAAISLALSMIALFFGVPIFCAIPSLIFASLALSKSYDDNQRQSYANIALGLMVASYVTTVVFIVTMAILIAY